MSVPRLSSDTWFQALVLLCVAACALLLANLGCSSGAVCYRQTDCPLGSSCQSGQCVRSVALGNAGAAGGPSTDGAGGSDGVSTAGSDGTAGSVSTTGGDGTAGSVNSAGTAGT